MPTNFYIFKSNKRQYFRAYLLGMTIFSLLILGMSTQAVLIRPLDELKVIEVTISQHDLTRISVKDDRILNIFGLRGEYTLEADEDQGQVFIRPDGFFGFEGTQKPIHVTLTTEGGHTQDLRLIPKDQPPEALILTAENNGKEELVQEKRITRNEVETLLQACKEGRIPLRYKVMPLNLITLRDTYLLLRELKGDKLRGLTYEVKNTTSRPLILSEPSFAEKLTQKKNRIVAILMTKKTLNPGERSFVHVVEKL